MCNNDENGIRMKSIMTEKTKFKRTNKKKKNTMNRKVLYFPLEIFDARA